MENEIVYVCSKCGKPATVSLQETWKMYSIISNDNFELLNEWSGKDNELWCTKCARELGYTVPK